MPCRGQGSAKPVAWVFWPGSQERGRSRDRRGVRHDLCMILSSAVTTGVLAGCRSLTTIWEHTTDLEGLGLPVGFS